MITVPLGKIAFIRRVAADVGGSKSADVFFCQRTSADTVSAPFTASRLFHEFAELNGPISETFTSYKGPFAAKTDLWASAVGPTGGGAISAEFDIVLINA